MSLVDVSWARRGQAERLRDPRTARASHSKGCRNARTLRLIWIRFGIRWHKTVLFLVLYRLGVGGGRLTLHFPFFSGCRSDFYGTLT